MVVLSIYQDVPPSSEVYEKIRAAGVMGKLETLDSKARRKGLESLDASNPLVAIGMEVSGDRVVKNGYGVFNLSWQSAQHPEWADTVVAELDEIREGIRAAHGHQMKFLIWAGMGGSAEDKSAYNAARLLNRGPRCYVLDSTDPAKLKAILQDMTIRSGLPLRAALQRTLVVGMAMGMTSYEPVVNLTKLAELFERERVDSRANFIYMTLPGSLLDQFARERGYRRVELQLDNGNTTAGRHSAPMTRGSLYPLGLCGVELASWMRAAVLTEAQIDTALRLASFLHTQGLEGRDKVTLMLGKELAGAALWTKQDFEESLGKSEELGIKIVIDEKIQLTNYRPPRDPHQDRVFLGVHIKGGAALETQKIATLRRAGYPVAVLSLPKDAQLSTYMQFIHYVVFGIAHLRGMNFVTQPSVELYKAITNRLHAEAVVLGSIEKTAQWRRSAESEHKVKWRGGVTLLYDWLPESVPVSGKTAPEIYASILKAVRETHGVQYGELTYFGDTRYSADGKAMKTTLQNAAERIFRQRCKMPADVYEGPAMNHSYHEMIIGHGRCLSTVVLSEKAEQIEAIGFTADYHRAQFLATQMALAERGRPVVSITVRDLEPASLRALDEFFREAAKFLKGS